MRVERKVAVRCIRRNGDIADSGSEIYRLRTGNDECFAVRSKSGQGVEQYPPCGDVLRSGRRSGHRVIIAVHQGFSLSVSERSESRHEVSFNAIHSSSAAPSAGIRPLPVRQSMAAWDGDT